MAAATEIKEVDIKDLKPYKKNAKIHGKEQVEMIADSIKEFGFVSPCLIDRDMNLIAGHGRVEAAKLLKMETVPCVFVEGLTDEQRRAYILADNRLGELAEWDMDLVQEELADLADLGFDIDLTGFELFEEEEEQEAEEDGYSDEDAEQAPTRCQPGDIWELGEHRLICGDCTDPDVIKALMDGEEVDLFLTDPPYNVDYGGKNRKMNVTQTGSRVQADIENDKMSGEEFRQFLTDAFTNAFAAAKTGAAFYVWHVDSETVNFVEALRSAGWWIHQTLIWVKNNHVLGRLDYQKKHKPCLYGWKQGAEHYFIDSRSEMSVYEDTKPEDIKKMKKEELAKLLKEIYSDKNSTSVIHEDSPLHSDLHPTMKPVKLMGRLIRNSSRAGEIVLDTFCGSGSTLIACEQLKRRCYMSEISPHYCDVILDRWERLTGKTAEKIG